MKGDKLAGGGLGCVVCVFSWPAAGRREKKKIDGRAVGVGGLSRAVVAGFLCLARAGKSLVSCPGLAGRESKKPSRQSCKNKKERENSRRFKIINS